MGSKRQLIFYLVTILYGIHTTQTKCTWTSIKENSLRCVDVNQDNLKETLLENTEFGRVNVLNLTYNKYGVLDNSRFPRLESLRVLNISSANITTFVCNFESLHEFIAEHNGFTEIDKYWFPLCKELRIVNLANNNLEKIGTETFSSMLQLHTLLLNHNRLSEFDGNAIFDRFNVLECLRLDNNEIDAINRTTFEGLSSLKILDLQNNSISFIVTNSFRDLCDVRNISLENTRLTILETRALAGLEFIQNLNLSGMPLEIIGDEVFAEMASLKYLRLDNINFTSIGGNAFAKIAKLKLLSLQNVTVADKLYWFVGTTTAKIIDLKYHELQEINNETFCEYSSLNLTDVHVTAMGYGYYDSEDRNWWGVYSALNTLILSYGKIKSVDKNAFYCMSKLGKLFLDHNQISIIVDGGFLGLSQLTKLDLSYNEIEDINTKTFCETPNLSLLSLNLTNNKLESIKQNTFSCMRKLENLSLSNNQISSIHVNAFADLEHLQELNLLNNNNISVLNQAMFWKTHNLQRLFLQINNSTAIERNCFHRLNNLTFLEIHGNNVSLGKNEAFNKISSLEKLKLIGVFTIETDAFKGLEQLHSLFLEESNITTFTDSTLSGFPQGFKYLSIDRDLNRIESKAFRYLRMISEIHIKNSDKLEIFNDAFSGATHLKGLHIENSTISFIDSYAFRNSGIETIYMFNSRITTVQYSSVPVEFDRGYRKYLYHREYAFDNYSIKTIKRRAFEGYFPYKMDLSFNELSIVHTENFNGLAGAETILLNNNQIQTIEINGFYNLPALEVLDLSFNKLSLIQKQQFVDLPHLRRLNLKGNLIERIEESLFASFPYLEFLDLSQNLLKFLTRDTFNGLEILTKLKLEIFLGGNLHTNSLLETTGSNITFKHPNEIKHMTCSCSKK